MSDLKALIGSGLIKQTKQAQTNHKHLLHPFSSCMHPFRPVLSKKGSMRFSSVLGKYPPPLSQLSLNKSHVFLLDLSWVQFLAPGQFSFLSHIVLERGAQGRGRVVDVVYWGCNTAVV